MLLNLKTGCSRKLFLPENEKLSMPKDPTKMWNWDLKVMSSINYQNLFGWAMKNIHQEHPQILQSYIRKIKIYLNDAKPKILL